MSEKKMEAAAMSRRSDGSTVPRKNVELRERVDKFKIDGYECETYQAIVEIVRDETLRNHSGVRYIIDRIAKNFLSLSRLKGKIKDDFVEMKRILNAELSKGVEWAHTLKSAFNAIFAKVGLECPYPHLSLAG